VDTLPVCSDKYKWAWFHKYCTAIRAAQSFIQNTQLPKAFAVSVRKRLEDIKGENERSLCLDYEDNDSFQNTQDEQILAWLNRYFLCEIENLREYWRCFFCQENTQVSYIVS
jgi:hypothetical protein